MRAPSLARGLLAFFLAMFVATFSADAAVEIISLTYRNPTEVLPLVKSMLSPEGKISADERTNSLIIVDSAEAIARVRQSLAVIDAPVRQAMVRVRFQDSAGVLAFLLALLVASVSAADAAVEIISLTYRNSTKCCLW